MVKVAGSQIYRRNEREKFICIHRSNNSHGVALGNTWVCKITIVVNIKLWLAVLPQEAC